MIATTKMAATAQNLAGILTRDRTGFPSLSVFGSLSPESAPRAAKLIPTGSSVIPVE
jgi:hypothetical protein